MMVEETKCQVTAVFVSVALKQTPNLLQLEPIRSTFRKSVTIMLNASCILTSYF